jgi:hypothetical protein
MNGMRKWIGFLLAVVLAGLALPANAAQPSKIFSLVVSGSVPVGGGGVSATITNQSPTGNSSLNSFIIVRPANATITGPYSSVPAGAAIALDPATGNLKVNGFKGLLPVDQNGPHTIVINFTVNPLANPCATTLTWSAIAYAGNSWSGDTFALQPSPPSSLGMTVTGGGCTLLFMPGPANAVVNTVITNTALNPAGPSVKVGLYTAGNVLVNTFNGVVTLSKTGPGSVVGNLAQASGGTATFSALQAHAAGDYTLTPSSGILSGNPAAFHIFDSCAAANSALDPLQTNPNNLDPNYPGYAAGNRGLYNKDGSECAVVTTTFTNYIQTNNINKVSLVWDLGNQPGAAFEYSVNWNPVSVDTSSGWTSKRPQVSWLSDSNSNAEIFIDAQACLSSNLPAPYGTFNSDNTTNHTIDVTATATVPAGQFPIVVDTERMQVTGVSGSTWNVTRTQPVGHAAGALVMSTPLPLLTGPFDGTQSGYVIGNPARVCMADHEWVPAGENSAGVLQIQYFTTIIDIGDSTVKLP